MLENTILIIDDSKDDIYLLKYAINKIGLKNPIEVASDGQSGLARLRSLVEKGTSGSEKLVLPAFVFLDLKMPTLNGFEVLEGIRKMPELAELVVIVLTSSDIESDVLLAYELGARSYLVKPPNPEI